MNTTCPSSRSAQLGSEVNMPSEIGMPLLALEIPESTVVEISGDTNLDLA